MTKNAFSSIYYIYFQQQALVRLRKNVDSVSDNLAEKVTKIFTISEYQHWKCKI